MRLTIIRKHSHMGFNAATDSHFLCQPDISQPDTKKLPAKRYKMSKSGSSPAASWDHKKSPGAVELTVSAVSGNVGSKISRAIRMEIQLSRCRSGPGAVTLSCTFTQPTSKIRSVLHAILLQCTAASVPRMHSESTIGVLLMFLMNKAEKLAPPGCTFRYSWRR